MVKLKAKLPKDDANGLDAYEQELVGNLRNGRTVPVIALLATEDVLARNQVPIAVIADIETVPEGSREYVLQLMGTFKADRTGAKQGAVQLDLNEEGDVEYVGEGDEQ
ncbi:hypothetical protein [Microbacterium sp. KNMS]